MLPLLQKQGKKNLSPDEGMTEAMNQSSKSNPPCSTSRFLTMSSGIATKYFFLDSDLASMGPAAADWSYRQLAEFKGIAEFDVIKGTTPADFLENGLVLLIVSDRVIKIMHENHLSGFSTYRVRIRRNRSEIPGYHGLAIIGRGGPNDKSLEESRIDPRSGKSYRKINGLRPTTWDGSDFFTLDDLYRVTLVTERVKSIFQKEKISNCLLEPAENFHAL
jgi:hypothetical protein